MRVYKYEVPVSDYFTIEMPVGARILSIQTQFKRTCIWALVDPNAEKQKRNFRLCGTGHIMDDSILAFIGTCQIDNGQLVFHVFEIE